MKLLLIHGAGASPLSWRTFEAQVGIPCSTFGYDVNRPFERLLSECLDSVEQTGADVVVGHSFGGILAWHAAKYDPSIFAGVTTSSPWGGSRYADAVEAATLGLLPTRFFANCMRSARHSVEPRHEAARVPWMNVVTTRGVLGGSPNDGVLTVASQDALYSSHNLLRVSLDYNHSEVLHADDLAKTAAFFVRRVARGNRKREENLFPSLKL